jgi:hypothetical protein
MADVNVHATAHADSHSCCTVPAAAHLLAKMAGASCLPRLNCHQQPNRTYSSCNPAAELSPNSPISRSGPNLPPSRQLTNTCRLLSRASCHASPFPASALPPCSRPCAPNPPSLKSLASKHPPTRRVLNEVHPCSRSPQGVPCSLG